MADASNPELLPSLGRLTRGLSALFWGLPVALIVCAQTSRGDAVQTLGLFAPLAATGWLIYGVWQLTSFQSQTRTWRRILDRTLLLGWVNFGLAPFLVWANRLPSESYFNQMLLILLVSGTLFLSSLNVVLAHLAAMLPDEALRLETRGFALFNRILLLGGLAIALIYFGLRQMSDLPFGVRVGLLIMERYGRWLMLGLFLLPLATTMALLWRIKEVVLHAVFSGNAPPCHPNSGNKQPV